MTEYYKGIQSGCNILFTFQCVWPQGCSSPIVVKFADTQKDKEQRRLQQQLAQQMQQLNTATWGNLTGLGGLTPQYLAVSAGVCGSVWSSWRKGIWLQNWQKLLVHKYVRNLLSLRYESQGLWNQHQSRFLLIKLISITMWHI